MDDATEAKQEMPENEPIQVAEPERKVPLSAITKAWRFKTHKVPSPGKPGQFRLKVSPGDPNEIYIKLLNREFGREWHTPTEWAALLDRVKSRPAHPSHPGATSAKGA